MSENLTPEKKRIEFNIFGPLTPWAAHQGSGKKSYNPRSLERKSVQWQLRNIYRSPLLSQPLSISFTYHIRIPKSINFEIRNKMLSGKIRPTKRPDLTNLTKFYEDCLKGIVITDDSIIIEKYEEKLYCDTLFIGPTVVITIDPL